jgi:hypothetical protein
MWGKLYFLIACLLYTGILLHLYTNYDQFDVITSGIELFLDGTCPYSLKSFEIIFFQRGDRK